jgi:hypothetical protein
MKKIELIIEKSDGLFWGRTEGRGWMPTPYGRTMEKVIENLKELVTDYVAHEGKNDKKWHNIDWEKVTFNYKYDLAAFFEKFNYLNLSAISGKIGINRTLLNQYKTGQKYPSEKQAKKIEDAIHTLANELQGVKLVA